MLILRKNVDLGGLKVPIVARQTKYVGSVCTYGSQRRGDPRVLQGHEPRTAEISPSIGLRAIFQSERIKAVLPNRTDRARSLPRLHPKCNSFGTCSSTATVASINFAGIIVYQPDLKLIP